MPNVSPNLVSVGWGPEKKEPSAITWEWYVKPVSYAEKCAHCNKPLRSSAMDAIVAVKVESLKYNLLAHVGCFIEDSIQHWNQEKSKPNPIVSNKLATYDLIVAVDNLSDKDFVYFHDIYKIASVPRYMRLKYPNHSAVVAAYSTRQVGSNAGGQAPPPAPGGIP